MPDPISLPNAPIGGSYDLGANACVAAPPAASPAAAPTAAPAPSADDSAALGAGAQQLIAGYAKTASTASAEAAKPRDCELETVKAVAVCGQMVVSTVTAAPTVVGAVLTGFFGGVACGLASAEAYDCYKKQP